MKQIRINAILTIAVLAIIALLMLAALPLASATTVGSRQAASETHTPTPTPTCTTTPGPVVAVFPAEGYAGQEFTFTGSHFTPNGLVHGGFDDPNQEYHYQDSFYADSSGGFVRTIATEVDWLGGVYAYIAHDVTKDYSASVGFTVYGPTPTFTATWTPTSVATGTATPTPTPTATATATPTGVYTALLPSIQKYVPPNAKLGVDFGFLMMEPDVLDYDLPLAKEMGAGWARIFLSWLEVETSPGEYDWGEYDPVLERFGELGFDTIVVIYGAPDWAAELSCGPISDTLALESFLEVLVPRYAGVVDAWEFINEPDGRVPHPYGPMIGCWGLHPAEYARQLGIFHSEVKDLDPDALIFFGGLAYDCWGCSEAGNIFERDFFEKALQNGAGAYFDGVSLHYYPISLEMFPTMAHKVNEIRDIMSRNEVYQKKIWVTETGMWVNLNGSLELQRDFIVRELTRGFGAGVDNIFWFDPREHYVPEWAVHRWLISANHEPINGYYTFQNLAEKLEGMHYLGAYGGVPEGVEAYKFRSPQRSLYILWSNVATATVRLPATADAVLTNRDGDESSVLPVQMGMVEFEVGEKPVFVEMAE